MTSARPKPRLPGMTCPHCCERAFARSSERLSLLYREFYYRCSNDACGHTFVVGMSILRTLVPSMMPNPAVSLPRSQFTRHPARPKPEQPPANDDLPVTPPPAANDDMTEPH